MAEGQDQQAVQRAYKEFVDLLPMTLAIAGLRESESARSFTHEQMEARANVVAGAFKAARKAMREAIRNP